MCMNEGQYDFVKNGVMQVIKEKKEREKSVNHLSVSDALHMDVVILFVALDHLLFLTNTFQNQILYLKTFINRGNA